MLQQDWFMRQIEMAARILAAILHKVATGERAEALAMFDQAYQPLLGVDARIVPNLPDEHLLDVLAPGGIPDRQSLSLVAQLLVAEAGLYAEVGDHDAALARYYKAAMLIDEAAVLIDQVGGDAQLDPAVAAQAAAGLRTYRLTAPLRVLAARLSERAGRYADAEDTLFEGIDGGDGEDGEDPAENDSAGTEALVDAGIGMYRRLLARDDADLAAGNLPRGEVTESLAELLAIPPVVRAPSE